MMAVRRSHFFCKWNDSIIIIPWLIFSKYNFSFNVFTLQLVGSRIQFAWLDFFSNFFAVSILHGTLGKKTSEKKTPQNMYKLRLHTFGNDFGQFWNLKVFWFFWKFSQSQPCMEHWAKKIQKKMPQNMFKTSLDNFGNDFGHFWNFENFLIFLKVLADLTLHGTLGKKLFLKNCPKTCSKHVWTILGTFLDIFLNFQHWFFWKISKTGPSMKHWAKKNSEKLPQNMFKTSLTTIGNDFRHFWNFEKFWFFWKPSKTGPSMEHWAEKKSEKLHQKMLKTRLNNFGNDFGHSLEFSKMIFLKTFEDTTLHGALGKFFFRKNCPKTCSKHVWTLLGTILGILGFLKKKWFFRKLSKTGTSMEHWTKNFGKLHQNMFKRRLDNFRNDFGHFWNFENFLTFLKFFADLTLHGTLGRNKFSEKLPQNMFKTRLNTIGNDFGHFWIFEKILIFLKIFADLTLDGKLDKRNFFGKIAPKRVQNTFAHFWKRFWSFLEFESFLIFLKIFAVSTLHGTLGKKISKKLPQNMFKTSLDNFGNDFGHFWNFENFLIFLKVLADLTLHGTLGKKLFLKNCPKTCSKHVWTILGTFLDIFWIFKIDFFENFRRHGPPRNTGQIFFFGKIAPKHVQNTFEHYWERFWAFLDFWKILIFLKNFED